MRASLLLAACLLLLPGLGNIGLWAPDEPRYAQVAEELRSFQHGPTGLVLLHLNGEPYTQKPPLYFWLAAGTGAAWGRVTEVAARLPSALAGIAVVACTLVLGRRLVGGPAGLLGAALLLTTFEFAHLARRAQLDVLLTLFETLALLAFWRLDRGLGRRALNVALLHSALGLGVLTKGPVGLLVPLLVMLVYLAWERRLRDLRRAFPPWALLLSCAPGLAWIGVALLLAPPGTAGEAIGTNVFGRFFQGTSHARPFFYYLYSFPLDFLPWTVLWPAVYWAARRSEPPLLGSAGHGDTQRRAWRLLLSWVGASLVFFSLSGGKRGLYLLPAFPATALLCADALLRLLESRTRMPRPLSWAAACWALLLVAAGATAIAAPLGPRLAIEETYLVAFGAATLGVIAAASVAWVVYARNRAPLPARLGVAVCAAFGIELAAFLLLFPGLDPGKSPRPIAEAAAELTAPEVPIGLVGDRALAGGLVYYAHRPVALLDSPEEITRFVEEGGQAIVVQRRKLDRIESVLPVRTHASFRDGRRAMLVVSPLRDRAHQTPGAPEGSGLAAVEGSGGPRAPR